MSPRTLAILALILSSTIWGAAAPIFKWSLENVPLFSFGFIRFAVATIILFVFVYKKLSIAKEDLMSVVRLGLWGVTLNVFFFLSGLKLTLAINASIMIATIPIFTLIAATIFFKEKLTRNIIISAAVAFLGITTIFAEQISQFGLSLNILGNILLMSASLSWLAYEIEGKKLFTKYSPTVLTFYTMLIGAHTFLPFALVEFFQNPAWPQHLEFKGYFGLVYGAVLSSALAYFLWQWGLSKLPISEAGLFLYLNPIAGVAVAILLLGEQITAPFLVGGLLVFAGVVMAESGRLRHPLHQVSGKR